MTHSGEEYGVGLLAYAKRLFWERVAYFVDGIGTADSFGVGNVVIETFGYGIHYGHTLCHDFRTYAVAWENCEMNVHGFGDEKYWMWDDSRIVRMAFHRSLAVVWECRRSCVSR